MFINSRVITVKFRYELGTGMDCDIESSCLALQKNYEETWIKGVKPFIKASKFQKDEIGQALIINS